jgi:hypothetical protein
MLLDIAREFVSSNFETAAISPCITTNFKKCNGVDREEVYQITGD